MDPIVKTALIQHRWNSDPVANRAGLIASIRQAAAAGARLVCLAELHEGPYFCQVEDPAVCDRAEPIPGPATACYGTLAGELGLVLVTSLFERRAPGLFHNTAVVFDADGRQAGLYRKMHIPDDPGFYEKFYFTPGDLGFTPISTAVGRLGVLVCWDQWYPEASRLMALAGAEVLIYPTAIGWDRREDAADRLRQAEAWQTVQRGQAIANGLPLLAINRCGHEADPSGQGPGLDFWGRSFAAGPQGELLACAGEDPALLLVELDRRRTDQVRRMWPFFRDRRIDAYADLLRRWRD